MTDEFQLAEDEIAELRRILNGLVLDELANGSTESNRRVIDAMAAFERRLVALEDKLR